ncbi:GH19802 [Drosophila grimshawi]|uniref:GH19802 n=1 Tax=Drosophila grimshawi TaxID=7222 RepID=B4JA13_DROGR|nr:GH19802 [Drosophila grimshawi]
MKTQMYNNITAAANPESTSNSTPYTTSQPDSDPDPSTDNDNDNDNNTDDTDSSSTITVCQQQQQPQPQPQLPQQTEDHNATTTTISDICNPNPDHPTVETLTPATSSEDIFYSPIGSPNNFNSSLGTQALLKSAAINAAPCK